MERPPPEAAVAAETLWRDQPKASSLSYSTQMALDGLSGHTWSTKRKAPELNDFLSAQPVVQGPSRTSSSAGDLSFDHACLASLLPHLEGIVRPQLAYQLLQLYFAPPEGTLFHNASPYVLTPVLRKEAVLNPASTRSTTPALLATMIWVSAQTASLPQLLAPGSRANLCSKLQDLVFRLLHDRDLDNWQRVSGGSLHS